MPLFRGLHGSLVPAARPGIHEKKPLLRKAFADLPHMSPNPIEASGGCGPRTPKGVLTVRNGEGHPSPFCFVRIYASSAAGLRLLFPFRLASILRAEWGQTVMHLPQRMQSAELGSLYTGTSSPQAL